MLVEHPIVFCALIAAGAAAAVTGAWALWRVLRDAFDVEPAPEDCHEMAMLLPRTARADDRAQSDHGAASAAVHSVPARDGRLSAARADARPCPSLRHESVGRDQAGPERRRRLKVLQRRPRGGAGQIELLAGNGVVGVSPTLAAAQVAAAEILRTSTHDAIYFYDVDSSKFRGWLRRADVPPADTMTREPAAEGRRR